MYSDMLHAVLKILTYYAQYYNNACAKDLALKIHCFIRVYQILMW